MNLFLRRACAASVLPLALVLASCGNSSEPSASSSSGAPSSAATSSSGALDKVQVSGGSAAAAPTVTVPQKPFSVSATEHRVVKQGTGEAIAADSKIDMDYVIVDGRDGGVRESAWGAGKSQRLAMANVPQFAALVGQKVGAQVLIAMPAKDAYPPQGANPQLKVESGDTVLFLLAPVAVSKPLTQAEGTAVPPKAGLPVVKMGATAKDPATFTLPKGDPPKTTVAQPLIVGKGPKVVAGQTLRVTYTGVTWRDPAKPFDYSGKGPGGYAEFPVGVGKLIKAWDEHLVGQSVGTRLLLVVPPADGYGAKGQGEDIKGTDTLVFVVDILDAS